jgi:hypothetical protein
MARPMRARACLSPNQGKARLRSMVGTGIYASNAGHGVLDGLELRVSRLRLKGKSNMPLVSC